MGEHIKKPLYGSLSICVYYLVYKGEGFLLSTAQHCTVKNESLVMLSSMAFKISLWKERPIAWNAHTETLCWMKPSDPFHWRARLLFLFHNSCSFPSTWGGEITVVAFPQKARMDGQTACSMRDWHSGAFSCLPSSLPSITYHWLLPHHLGLSSVEMYLFITSLSNLPSPSNNSLVYLIVSFHDLLLWSAVVHWKLHQNFIPRRPVKETGYCEHSSFLSEGEVFMTVTQPELWF